MNGIDAHRKTEAGGPGLRSAAAVLWDIDGTLLTSGGVTVRAFLDAVEDVTGARPSPGSVDYGGRIDPEIAALLLETTGESTSQVPAVLKRHEELVAERADALRSVARPLAGVTALLGRLADTAVPQTVVTGNIESVARLKLDAAGLVPPIDPGPGGYGDSGATRIEVARFAMTQVFGPAWPSAADRSWIIGDTPRDLACATALGLRCALVGTGRHPASSMAGLGADVVLSSLDDADGVRRLWDGPAPD